MQTAEEFIEKLLKYYKVDSVAKLSIKMNVSQATISNWKIRNSISAMKKKCRELEIFDLIFKNDMSELNMRQSTNFDDITFKIFAEAYQKAKDKNKLNEFRIYLMQYKF